MKTRLVGGVLSVLLVLGGCATPTNDDEDPAGDRPARQTARSGVELPETPAGRQLSWFLEQVAEGDIGRGAYQRRFAQPFRDQLDHDQMTQLLDGLTGLKPIEILSDRPRALVVLAGAAGRELEVTIRVNADDVIETLLLRPHQERPAPPTTWAALDARLEQVAPESGFLAAEVTEDGRCAPIHGVRPGAVRPVGSMFKLYVLDTVARQVEQERLGWDDELTIGPRDKSLPTGELQDRPNGSTVTVAEAARLMISISDNTATDLLIKAVGREAVVETIGRTSQHAAANNPLLTTRELFVLKGVEYPRYVEQYLDREPAERADWLVNTLGEVDLDGHEPWAEPRNITTVEWFAAPNDICAAYAELTERDGVDEALSRNDGGLGLDSKEWPRVWFKGGSEPGVLALGYLAEATDGSRYVLTVMAEDSDAALDESTVTLELLSLVEGASRLVSGPS